MKPFVLTKETAADIVPWKARDLALILVAADGSVEWTNTVEEKRQLLTKAAESQEPCTVLVAWPGQYRQDIFVVTPEIASGALSREIYGLKR